MKKGLKVLQLPESQADYELLMANGSLRFKLCCFGNHPHIGRTHTRGGWAETQISGSCEECFDDMFKDND